MTSSLVLKPATTDRKLSSTCLASLDFRSLSTSSTMEIGVASARKEEILCSTLSSKIRNSSRRKSGTMRPDPSLTVTGTMTWLAGDVIFGPTWGAGAWGFCCFGSGRRTLRRRLRLESARCRSPGAILPHSIRFYVDFSWSSSQTSYRILPLRRALPRIHRGATLHPTGRHHPSGTFRPGNSRQGKYTCVLRRSL